MACCHFGSCLGEGTCPQRLCRNNLLKDSASCCSCQVEKQRLGHYLEPAAPPPSNLFALCPAPGDKVDGPKADPAALHFKRGQGEVPARVPLLQRTSLRGEGCCRYRHPPEPGQRRWHVCPARTFTAQHTRAAGALLGGELTQLWVQVLAQQHVYSLS